jgi:hypothetical protein
VVGWLVAGGGRAWWLWEGWHVRVLVGQRKDGWCITGGLVGGWYPVGTNAFLTAQHNPMGLPRRFT